MGDIAEQIVEGMICQLCCCSDGRDPQGYPYTCAECGGDVVEDDDPSIFDLPEKQKTINPMHHATRGKSKKIKCPHCDKMVAEVGLEQHTIAKHMGRNDD